MKTSGVTHNSIICDRTDIFVFCNVHQELARTFVIQLPFLGLRRVPKVNEAEGVSNNGCGIGFVFYVEGDAFL